MPLTQTRPPLALYAAGLLIIGMALAGPIVQPANYHHFADARALFGIPNAADVLSNIGFLLAGVYGLALMWRARLRNAGFALFCVSLLLTAFGSSWYHLAPDDARLVWDRLPIALACAGLLGAVVQQAYPRVTLVAPLAIFGALSVFWWARTGDLRPYLLLQLAPLVLIPLLQWQSGASVGQRRAFGVAIFLYVLAKVFELGDLESFKALGILSGHTVKHILAALAAVLIVRNRAR
ncbi:MAG: hypothetical protein V4633_17570 [Pseudomonadota bacterium]